EVANRLVRMLAQDLQPVARGRRRGARLDGDEEILPLDGADIGVALGGQRIDAVGEDLERVGLAGGVGRGRERLAHGGLLFRASGWMAVRIISNVTISGCMSLGLTTASVALRRRGRRRGPMSSAGLIDPDRAAALLDARDPAVFSDRLLDAAHTVAGIEEL